MIPFAINKLFLTDNREIFLIGDFSHPVDTVKSLAIQISKSPCYTAPQIYRKHKNE
jgi:hypothetical protein